MSRLVPTPELQQYLPVDPNDFSPPGGQFVVLREGGEDVPFDPSHPTAADAQRKLELVNEINRRPVVTYTPHDYYSDSYLARRILRPLHIAIFTDTFDLHGRLYGKKHSHQGLSEVERVTIRFDSEHSIELDYSGLHPRMLYHSLGLDYDDDPYALFGSETTPAQRALTKIVLNTAINAKSRQAAIGSCYETSKQQTPTGKWKSGKKLRKAQRYSAALRETGLSFPDIYDKVLEKHKGIQGFFSTGKGLELMRRDSRIALNVLKHFAGQGTPCLAVHDSFIVPSRCESELRGVMIEAYREEMGGFEPHIK